MDGAAFLDLSEEDVKTLVKPLGHIKRVLRLVASVKTKVICSCFKHLVYDLHCAHLQEAVSSSSDPIPAEKKDAASGSSLSLSTASSAQSARCCDYEGSSDSSSLPTSPIFKDGVPVNYSLPKCFSANVMESLDEEYATQSSKCLYT